jgi:hypothetical protein
LIGEAWAALGNTVGIRSPPHQKRHRRHCGSSQKITRILMKNFLYILSACTACVLGYSIITGNRTWIARLQGHLARADQVSEISHASDAIYREVNSPDRTLPRDQFCPSTSSISFAKSAPLVWFDPKLSGGSHTWIVNGAEVIKALTAYCGDFRLNTDLLSQIRNVLTPSKGPTATGGYQDQKQLGVAFMFLIARRTPVIWDQLSEVERALIDLTMEAFMYSSAFTTKDEVAVSLGMNGDTNLNRDWNPNYQNGMVGMIILTALYWGFDQFESELATYDDAAFLRKLRASNLKNLLSTYESPARPKAIAIQAGLRKLVQGEVYRFHGISDRNLLGLFNYIASRTFSAEISCGLNGGSGIDGFGRMVKTCDLLPNVRRKGMILEFDGWDAEGKRSSSTYSWDSWYPLNYVRAALQIDGWLTPSTLGRSATLVETMNRYRIGSNDLLFKLSPEKGGGYRDYAHGTGGETVTFGKAFMKDHGADANVDLFNILQRTLELPAIDK